MMRMVFFGTPEFAVPSLKEILRSRHPIVAVVTQPDRKKGRSSQPTASAVKEAVQGLGIPVLQPEKVGDPSVLNTLQVLAPQIGIVVAYGQLLPVALLKLFPKGVFNLHASLLPKYRGGAPIQWALMNGDQETGVTVFQLDEKLDHGPMLLQARYPIGPEEDAETLRKGLSELGAQTVMQGLDGLERGSALWTPQDEKLATYAPRLNKEDGLIDWGLNAQVITNRARGLKPWPGAYTYWEGKLLKLLSMTPDLSRHDPKVAPGTVVLSRADQGLWVQTGQGQMEIKELQLEGGKSLPARTFLRGHPIPQGSQLSIL